ncbi:MAG TPA: sulfotransferase domain-containing protein, partial [Rhizomicrobium sp.]|nr:sulfotransferase domain-containing protein [Rhizomicrobium sp.]
RKLGKKRPCVILAFPPKAAGTYFRTAIIAAVGGQLLRVVHAQGGRDATPYLPTFVAYFNGGLIERTLVSHVHMQALPANINFLEAFGIRPIIMKRSIPDMLASYWDMLMKDPTALEDGLNCRIPENFRTMPDAQKADFMIDVLGPWYASYFATWLEYAADAPDTVCVLAYREFKDDPAGTLMRAVEHAGLPRTRQECEKALNIVWERRDQYRYNKGETGRSTGYFGPEHIARLGKMLGYYPNLKKHRDELLGVAQEPVALAAAS